MDQLEMNDLEKVSGGLVVEDPVQNKCWIIRQNGTVIAPAPSREQAVEFAGQFNTSTEVITLEEYRTRFGRDLAW